MEIPTSRLSFNQESDQQATSLDKNPRHHNLDAIVVGMGVLGLMLAKRLTDFGQSVAVIEQSPTIADGPSIKNHGWLHTGVVHSLSAQ